MLSCGAIWLDDEVLLLEADNVEHLVAKIVKATEAFADLARREANFAQSNFESVVRWSGHIQ